MEDSDKQRMTKAGGVIFVGCMFLGAGIGMVFGNFLTGGAIGMGVGFIVMGGLIAWK